MLDNQGLDDRGKGHNESLRPSEGKIVTYLVSDNINGDRKGE